MSERRSGPLRGLHVREYAGTVAVASCGRVLADLGATVEVDRVCNEPVDAPAVLQMRSAYNNRGKVVESGEGAPDIVLVDQQGWAERRDALQELADDGTVVVVVSPFGLTGPRSTWLGNDLVTQAYGGGPVRNGDPDREPLRTPLNMGDHETGLGAAAAALIAWFGAERGVGGQVVDVSSVEAWAVLQTGTSILEYLFQERSEQRHGRRYLGRGYPHTILRTSDGDARLICVQGREWGRALDMMGRPAWGDSERYANRLRNQEEYADELDVLVGEWLAGLTGDRLLGLAMDHQLPWVPIRQPSEVLAEPQLHARGYVREAASPEHRVGYPVRFSRTPAGSAPDPGLGRRPEPAGNRRARPVQLLDGIRVLDFSWAWAGGLVGAVLADFGAEVIKVESSRRLDPMRMDRPLIGTEQDIEQGSLHHNINRGKKSILVDITQPEGASLVARLAAEVDVVVENFSPGVLERRGLGYEVLAERNPALVYLSSSATGASGPLASLRAYAPVLTALGGVDAMVGYEGEEVRGLQHSLADPNAALHGVVAVVAALIEREGSGRGQWLDLSQLEAVIDLIAPVVLAAEESGESFTSLGNSDPTMQFSAMLRCTGDDDWLAVACETPEQLSALELVVGHTEGMPLHDRAAAWAAGHDKWAAATALQTAGVPAAPMLDIGERFADEHLQARGAFVDASHPVVGSEFLCGVPWHMSKTPGAVHSSAPLLGADTEQVLGDLLGMTLAELNVLAEKGVLR